MTTYYKCVRPDGTDSHSGTVRWVPEDGIPEGGWVVTHPNSHRLVLDNPATYLSVATVPTGCTGMRWPCRLLEVAPAGRQVRRDAGLLMHKRTSLAYKRTSLAWRVMRELPAWQALGPQGREVAAIIDRAARLTLDEATSLTAARAAARIAARAAARIAAWDAARIAAWDAAWDAAWVAAWDAARDAARVAARDAARAYLVRDLIPTEHFTILAGPWHKVIGAPEPIR